MYIHYSLKQNSRSNMNLYCRTLTVTNINTVDKAFVFSMHSVLLLTHAVILLSFML